MWRWSGQIPAGVGCTDLGLSVVAAPAPVRMFVSLHFNGAQHRARSSTRSSKQLRTRRENAHGTHLSSRYRPLDPWLLRPGTDSHLQRRLWPTDRDRLCSLSRWHLRPSCCRSQRPIRSLHQPSSSSRIKYSVNTSARAGGRCGLLK